MSKHHVSVITPVYNERRTLEENIRRIRESFLGTPYTYEIIIVDDNSPDGSGELADRIASSCGDVKVIHRPSRRGLGTAYKEAFPRTSGDLIVSMDSDLSHDPVIFPEMIRETDGADIVIGSRLKSGGKIIGRKWSRDLLTVFSNWAIRTITGIGIMDWTSGLRIYRRAVWEKMMPRVHCYKWDFQFESLYKSIREGFTVCEVPITFHERADGESKFSASEAYGFVKSFIKVVLGG